MLGDTIANLRQQGYKFRVTHKRYYQVPIGQWDYSFRLMSKKDVVEFNNKQNKVIKRIDIEQPFPRGGETCVTITPPGNEDVQLPDITIKVRCNPEDAYNKHIGYCRAMAKAISELSKEEEELPY